MSFDMTIKGADELDRKLSQMEPKIAKKHMAKALRAGAKLVLQATRARVPVLTGALKQSLAVRVGKRKRGRKEQSIQVLIDTKKVPELVTIGKDGKRYFYPAAIEYGTRRMAAKPFMRPAFDASKMEALNATMIALRNAIDQEATK